MGLLTQFSNHSVWLDIVAFIVAIMLLEAALTGRGRTTLRGHTSYWHVSPLWLRPILAVAGVVLISLAVISIIRRVH